MSVQQGTTRIKTQNPLQVNSQVLLLILCICLSLYIFICTFATVYTSEVILFSALPVHRRSQRDHQTHPAAFLVSAGTWRHFDGLLQERWLAADYSQNPSLTTHSFHQTPAPTTTANKNGEMKTEMLRWREVFCMNDPTNLEAVLVGFQNRVDLRGREDVAAES